MIDYSESKQFAKTKLLLQRHPAWSIVGGLSAPSKMPCYSYSIPSEYCKAGSELKKLDNSVCKSCYTFKGRYRINRIQNVLLNRYNSLKRIDWVSSMVALLKLQPFKYFRWHDSGDLQGLWHLEKIIQVARLLPEINFWLPTQESELVTNYVDHSESIPSNLIIRISSAYLNSPIKGTNLHTSVVMNNESFRKSPDGLLCRSYELGGKCGVCRQCWNKNIKNIIYLIH